MPHLTLSAGQPDEITGPYGTARRIPPANHRQDAPATLDAWIITAPGAHPLWSQYLLALVTLADVPGTPPAVRRRPGVTHELLLVALYPDDGPYDAATITSNQLRTMHPVNIAEQITATDTQARELTAQCAAAVVEGRLLPETGDAPDQIRGIWSHTIQRTLDHHRDPHHGHAN